MVENQMLELQSLLILEGSQQLFKDKIYETILGKRPGYSKGLGWGPKPKSRKRNPSHSSSFYDQEMYNREVNELKASLKNANYLTKEQRIRSEERG
ncbi:uncharacterized protein E6C27_scaffold1302G00120 [Cucumis melo var. makuwa]|uniref:Zinc finger protein ZPR1-like protein n=1 Tax=Cucumis melo var. makuwa TaxID=1194695 RepID=A0A5A7T9P8_CUCMM|nr:uncharacterized protein E6C27_scaffold1302G00120 [Cucumis melo var. makuwa]